MWIFILLFLTGSVYGQTIDCTQYQQQVNQLTSQSNDLNAEMTTAQSNLSNCQNVNTTVATPAYAQAVQSAQISSQIQSDKLNQNTP